MVIGRHHARDIQKVEIAIMTVPIIIKIFAATLKPVFCAGLDEKTCCTLGAVSTILPHLTQITASSNICAPQ